MRPNCVFALLVILFSSFALADSVVLTNGDRLTGTITKSDQKSLTLKTDYADDITIKWSAIQGISSSETLHVASQNGKTVAGPVTTSDGNFVVASPTGAVNVPKDEVSALRNDQEQAAYEQGDIAPLIVFEPCTDEQNTAGDRSGDQSAQCKKDNPEGNERFTQKAQPSGSIGICRSKKQIKP